MKNKLVKPVERTCVVCRKKDLKKNFLVLTKVGGKVLLNEGKLKGRSVYFCKQGCVAKILEKKGAGLVKYYLKSPVDEATQNLLKEMIS